jgi:hypothetical protein
VTLTWFGFLLWHADLYGSNKKNKEICKDNSFPGEHTNPEYLYGFNAELTFSEKPWFSGCHFYVIHLPFLDTEVDSDKLIAETAG